MNPDNTAFVLIDQTNIHSNPWMRLKGNGYGTFKHTFGPAAKNAELVEKFREKGIPVIIVFRKVGGFDTRSPEETLASPEGGLYRVNPDAYKDSLVFKTGPSAFVDPSLKHYQRGYGHVQIKRPGAAEFERGDITELLEGRENILIGGFATIACVSESVKQGLTRGYNMHVMQDAIGNGLATPRPGRYATRAIKPEPDLYHQKGLDDMREVGANMTNSKEVFMALDMA